MNKRVCFIGHRRIYEKEVEQKLKEAVEDEIKDGFNYFTMGTHGDFDKLALSVCRELRKKYNDIKIEVVLTSLTLFAKPKREYDDFYNPYQDVETLIFNIEDEYFKRRITKSNREMVDNADLMICYVDESVDCSGAKRAMRYAKKCGLEIINLYKER